MAETVVTFAPYHDDRINDTVLEERIHEDESV